LSPKTTEKKTQKKGRILRGKKVLGRDGQGGVEGTLGSYEDVQSEILWEEVSKGPFILRGEIKAQGDKNLGKQLSH